MFENVRTLKITVLLLLIYSAGTTIFIASKSYSGFSSLQTAQLNAQINNLKAELENNEKDNEDLKAIRALIEKERAEKEAGQRLHEKSLTGIRDQFKGLDKYDTTPPYDW